MKCILRKVIRLSLSLAITATLFSGCSPKVSEGAKVVLASDGDTPFMIDLSNTKNVMQYVDNFEQALHSAKKEKIEQFISVQDEKIKRDLSYLGDKELKELFKFYMEDINLELHSILKYKDRKILVVSADMMDNRYNDFKTPNIAGLEDTRAIFYQTVNERIEKYKNSDTPPKKVADEDFIYSKETDESLIKATIHQGWDYTDSDSITQWVEMLTKSKPALQRFNRLMLFEVKEGAELSKLEIANYDMTSLFGNLPVFYGLNSQYPIEDYDLFYNFNALWDGKQELEELLFKEWEAIRSQTDEQIVSILKDKNLLQDGLAFGKFQVDTDMNKIKKAFKPESLQSIMEMYYDEESLGWFTWMLERPEYRELIWQLERSTTFELIKQSGKTFNVVVTTPDVNDIVFTAMNATIGKDQLSPEEMVGMVSKAISAGDYKELVAYTKIKLQRADNAYLTSMVSMPIQTMICDIYNPIVLETLGFDDMFEFMGSADGDGVLPDAVGFKAKASGIVLPEDAEGIGAKDGAEGDKGGDEGGMGSDDEAAVAEK